MGQCPKPPSTKLVGYFARVPDHSQGTDATKPAQDISLTEYCANNNLSPEQAAQRMRDQVKKETGLTVSAGVSANATLSKIAADLRKPDGQYIVPSTRSGVMSFMNDLPIRKVPGIGRVSERWLTALNVNTVGDVYKMRGKLFLVVRLDSKQA